MNSAIRILVISTLVHGMALGAEGADKSFRTWTDSSGKNKTEAALVEATDMAVKLRLKKGGKVITVPVSKLSKKDRAYVRKAQDKGGGQSQEGNTDSLWLSDFQAFLKTLDAEVKKSNPQAPFNAFNDLFAGKVVRWKMKFAGSQREKDGSGAEQTELQVQFEGVPRGLSFVSSGGAVAEWGKLKGGTAVTIEAKVALASVITLNPDNQGQGERLAIVRFEETTVVGQEE